MTGTPAPEPASKFDWQRLILSLDLPPLTKLVAFAISIYASRDGGSAHPGNRRLAAELGMTTRTVIRHVAVLRDDCRLIERTFYGQHAGRRGLSDTYRLVVPWDLPARVSARDVSGVTPVTSSGEELVPPESPDNSPETPELVTLETGTGDSGDRTGVTPVTPPGSTHQVVDQPPADSIVAVAGEVNGSVEGSANGHVKTGFDYFTRKGTDEARQAQSAALDEWMASQS